jgi:hypothetical protein
MKTTNQNPSFNGRVFIGPSHSAAPDYQNVAEASRTPSKFKDDVAKGNMADGPVMDLFFSELNINMLQKGIVNMVLNKSCGKYRIAQQSTSELLTIMRATYLQESMNSIVDVVGQVKRLNELVLMYSVPRIINEKEMHDRYIKDISTLPVPMAYGQATSVAGTKTLELTRFF